MRHEAPARTAPALNPSAATDPSPPAHTRHVSEEARQRRSEAAKQRQAREHAARLAHEEAAKVTAERERRGQASMRAEARAHEVPSRPSLLQHIESEIEAKIKRN